jgi:hypothetical protein
LALLVSLGGTAIAASSLVKGDNLIKKHSLSGNRLKDHTLTGTQINQNKLGKVPNATNADKLGGKAPSNYVTVAALIAGLTPVPFTSPALGAGWANYTKGNSLVAYYKDQLGVVHLRGDATNLASPPAGSVIFQLPAGVRPSAVKDFIVPCGALAPAPGLITIDTAGNVTVEGTCSGAGSSSVFLEGITFRTDG